MGRKELIEGSKMIFYEYSTLNNTAKVLYESSLDNPIRTAVFESWVIHFRCLYYFLNPNRKKDKREFMLKDYLSEEEIKKFTPSFENWKESKYWKDKADKQLAHISKDRLQYNKTPRSKKWKYIVLTKKVNELFCDFLQLANNENLCPELINIKEDPNQIKLSPLDFDECVGS